MSNSDMCRELSLAMPGLDDATRDILARHGRPAELPRGAVIFRPGEACHQLVLLAQGAVQVRTISENGREIELYRVEPGETCVLRVIVGLALIALALGYIPGMAATPLGWIGVVPLVTGLIGWCPAYSIFGISTCRRA